MATEREFVWNVGTPPHVGWWLTLAANSAGRIWRWWDGARWSVSVGNWRTPEHAGRMALMRGMTPPRLIRWSNYWPVNARVPRVDPATVKADVAAPEPVVVELGPGTLQMFVGDKPVSEAYRVTSLTVSLA